MLDQVRCLVKKFELIRLGREFHSIADLTISVGVNQPDHFVYLLVKRKADRFILIKSKAQKLCQLVKCIEVAWESKISDPQAAATEKVRR